MLPSGAERHLSVIKYTGWAVQTRMPHSSQSLSACFQETRQRLYSPGSVHFYNRMTVQPMEIVKGCSPKWPALEPHSAELLFMRIAAYPAPTSALGLHVTGTENRVCFSLSSNTLRLNLKKKLILFWLLLPFYGKHMFPFIIQPHSGVPFVMRRAHLEPT